MAHLLIRHNVQEFTKWRAGYDAHRPVRQQYGCLGERLFRTSDSPENVIVLLEFDTYQNARRFVASDNLREAMQNAGVIGTPHFHFIEEVELPATGARKAA